MKGSLLHAGFVLYFSCGFQTVGTVLKPLALFFFHRARSYDPMCPRAWRLGAGGALTVLQFGPIFGYVRG
jgi:hypothetical protein